MPSHHTEMVPIGLMACEHWSTLQPATPWVGRREDDPHRWQRRWFVVGGYLLLTLALFAFFHPVYVADTIPYAQWRWRMWFPSWI